MESAFNILLRKDICEFLEGNGKSDLAIFEGKTYGMPYYSTNDLISICRSFGITEAITGSRWSIVETLLQNMISNNRIDELLTYFFSLERFDNLQEIDSMDDIQYVYQQIIKAAVKEINRIIRLTRKEFQILEGHFLYYRCGRSALFRYA